MATAEMKPRLLGISDAAVYLGISRQVMRIATNRGQVDWVRIGQRKMISTAVLDRMLKQGRAMLSPKQLRQRQAAGRASYQKHMERLTAEFGDKARTQFSLEASTRGKLGGRPDFFEAVRRAKARADAQGAGRNRR